MIDLVENLLKFWFPNDIIRAKKAIFGDRHTKWNSQLSGKSQNQSLFDYYWPLLPWLLA